MSDKAETRQAGFLKKPDLSEFLDTLESFGRLFAPVRVDRLPADFAPRSRGILDLDAVNTRTPAKNWVFPQCEKLYSWKRPPGHDWEVSENDKHGPSAGSPAQEPRAQDRLVLFGVRPCDARAIAILDRLFLDECAVDAPYAARRKGLFLVGLACTSCANTCFCSSFDFGPMTATDCDLFLTPVNDHYLVDVITDKGSQLLETASALLASPGDPAAAIPSPEDVEKQRAQIEKDVVAVQKERRPDVASARKALADAKTFEPDFWEELARTCLGCQACTFLCPTCHCYEIRDEGPRSAGQRYRLHDGCMSAEFTLHASGHNPRGEHFQRWRQRCYHKFSWFPETHGTALCVGCGRCTAYCPMGVDIVQVIEEVASSA